jgi:hypothetical protein
VRAIGLRPLHPQPRRRRRQIEIAGDCADGLVVIQDQSNALGEKLLIELPA